MIEKKISIVVPCYNREALMPRLLKSLESQTYKNLEVIIVDNGSHSKVASYLSQQTDFNGELRVERFDKNTGSPMACYNRGLEVATGEWIGFLYDDDTLLEDAVESLIDAANQSKSDWVVGNCIDTTTGKFSFRGVKDKQFITFEMIALGHASGEAWSIMKRALFGDIRFDENMYGGESSVWLQLYRNTNAYYIDKAVRIYYTDHGDNITGVKSWLKNIDKIVYTEQQYLKLFRDEFRRLNLTRKKHFRLALILVVANRKMESLLQIKRYLTLRKLHRLFIHFALVCSPRFLIRRLVITNYYMKRKLLSSMLF